MDKKTDKQLFVCAVILVIASFVFFFPKDDITCGSLAGGERACSTHRCAGIFINEHGITNISHDCLGFDLGYIEDDL